ncbi:MAG: DUF58 domain-containing protein [Ruminococcaceae bacterium]|nr:DUF58 domain-containing protein [Oscillospiraceae bacterium]
MYEEISNDKNLPIVFAKVDTELPDGLSFLMLPFGSDRVETQKGFVESIFSLRGHSAVKRRWRIYCSRRGVYSPGTVLIITGDMTGSNNTSRRYEVPHNVQNNLTVLPRIIDLDLYFTSSRIQPGEIALPRGLFTDAMTRAGTREYTSSDPMSKINWKSTASHGELQVNVEEFLQNYSFNIVINMQARDHDSAHAKPSVPYYIENNITVAASIIDRISAYDISVALIANTETEDFGRALYADDDMNTLRITESFSGSTDTLAAFHTLARMNTDISMPCEKMLDVILNSPYEYAPGGNLIFITAYFTERMVSFHREMKKLGINVSFYLTAGSIGVRNLPSDIEIFYIYSHSEDIDFSRESTGFYSEEISSATFGEER